MKNKRTIIGIICIILAAVGAIVWGAGSASAASFGPKGAGFHAVAIGDSQQAVKSKLGTGGKVYDYYVAIQPNTVLPTDFIKVYNYHGKKVYVQFDRSGVVDKTRGPAGVLSFYNDDSFATTK